jgi:cobalt-zinc-cadmium efflux system protein
VSRVSRLLVVLVLNLLLIAFLGVVGFTAHSLGVLAAVGDYLADSGAIVLALFAVWLGRRPATAARPNGYPRAPAYAALVNAVVLGLVVTGVIVAAAWRLLSGTVVVHGVPVLIASAIAAVVMVAGAVVLIGDKDQTGDSDADRANMRAVVLDTVADAFAAAGVACAGAIIAVTGGWYWLDPTIALIIAVVIGRHVVILLRDVIRILRTP